MLRSFDNPVVGDDVVGGRVGVVGCGLGVVHDDEAVDSLVVVEVASVGDLVVVVTGVSQYEEFFKSFSTIHPNLDKDQSCGIADP